MDPCVSILPANNPVKSVCSVDVPTNLRTAVSDSFVSPVPEIRTGRWQRQRDVQGVSGVHVDDLVGGGNLTIQKAMHWLRSELEFETWYQSLLLFRSRELSQEYNGRKTIKICMSKFDGARCCSQTCERWSGQAAGSICTLSISWRCRSASVVTAAKKSAPVVCHWNPASYLVSPDKRLRKRKLTKRYDENRPSE